MMKAMNIIAAVCFMFVAAVPSIAQTDGSRNKELHLGSELVPKDTTGKVRFKNRLIAPKGEWQCGISVMYANFSTSDSEYMMLLQGVSANASMFRVAPQAAYTFANNHAVGVMFQYTNINGGVDTATADLLGNFEISVQDLNASSRGLSASVFQRTYWGLDKRGRVGIFWDYILGYTRKNVSFSSGGASAPYTITHKAHLGFAPGIVYYPMNNVSVQVCLCLADVSYNYVRAYEGKSVVGTRHAWKAQANINVLDLNFGLTIHF